MVYGLRCAASCVGYSSVKSVLYKMSNILNFLVDRWQRLSKICLIFRSYGGFGADIRGVEG